jgi:hypothetical protein
MFENKELHVARSTFIHSHVANDIYYKSVKS